jgi:peptidoglycan L-alanyl-D-glutamate endopeptidase CwlK
MSFVNISIPVPLGIFNLRISTGFRSSKDQDALYDIGRQGPDDHRPILTNAKGGESPHQYGLAIDVAPIASDGSLNYDIDWDTVSELGKAFGFEWSGDWDGFSEKNHFQMYWPPEED